MSTLETSEASHRWDDLDHWRRELEQKPPSELAAAAHLWRRAVILQWLEAAGASFAARTVASCCRSCRPAPR
jgi:hypothetical protein